VVGEFLVLLFAARPGGADVHGGIDESGDVVKELVVGLDGDLVPVDDGDGGVDEHGGFGAHPMSDPPQA
jgi:hypothetical protein